MYLPYPLVRYGISVNEEIHKYVLFFKIGNYRKSSLFIWYIRLETKSNTNQIPRMSPELNLVQLQFKTNYYIVRNKRARLWIEIGFKSYHPSPRSHFRLSADVLWNSDTDYVRLPRRKVQSIYMLDTVWWLNMIR